MGIEIHSYVHVCLMDLLIVRVKMLVLYKFFFSHNILDNFTVQ